MPFAGTIGSVDAQPGTLVPGLVNEFGTQAFGVILHSLTSKSIRIKYARPVNDGLALSVDSYRLSVITPGSFLPEIETVRPYELDNMQYELIFKKSLTLNSTYSLEIFGVTAYDGIGGVNVGAYNFVATVPDYAIAIGAYSHKEGYLVIEYDRVVFPYTTAATASISPQDDLTKVKPLTWVPNTDLIPPNLLLFKIDAIDPTNSNYLVTYSAIKDTSLNTSNGSVPFIVPQEIPRPIDFPKLKSIRLLFSRITDWFYDHNDPFNSYVNVRAFFNVPVQIASAKNTSNWNMIVDGLPAEFINISASWINSYISYDYASSESACPDAQYFWHVDLRVRSGIRNPKILISAKIKSEDGLSETVPSTTGSSSPRPSGSIPKPLKLVSVPSVGFLARHDVGFVLSSPPSVSYPLNHQSPSENSISIYSLYWLLNNLWTSFDGHRKNASSHSTVDLVNMISETIPGTTLSDLISSANLLKLRILTHSTTAEYHGNVADYQVFSTPDAVDLSTLLDLIGSLANYFIRHTQNEFIHQGLRLSWLSAGLSDQIITSEPNQLIGQPYQLTFKANVLVSDNETGNTNDIFYGLSDVIIGLDYPPYVAVALPVPGLRLEFNGEVIRSDEVEVYFSKAIDTKQSFSYSFTSVAPPLEVTSFKWPSPTRLLFNVNKMRQKSYSLSLTGLKDTVGNLVP
jgi:hypothetical protein